MARSKVVKTSASALEVVKAYSSEVSRLGLCLLGFSGLCLLRFQY